MYATPQRPLLKEGIGEEYYIWEGEFNYEKQSRMKTSSMIPQKPYECNKSPVPVCLTCACEMS